MDISETKVICTYIRYIQNGFKVIYILSSVSEKNVKYLL